MCGIAGIFRLRPVGGESAAKAAAWTSALEAAASILDASIAHRGPDGRGLHKASTPGTESILLHRRLSIIDHAGGSQPMLASHGNRSLALTFNGCIYNHRHLRTLLQSRGHTFISQHSDTEALARLLLNDTAANISEAEGMFAFAALVRSSNEDSLVLGRDRAGEKPLYYVHQNDAVIFASTAAAVILAGNEVSRRFPEFVPPSLSHPDVLTFMRFGFSPLLRGQNAYPHTLREVPPGSLLTFLRSSPPLTTPILPPPSQIVQVDSEVELTSSLANAVSTRLEADVPVACFLSGGVDSSLVTLFASQSRPAIASFCVRMPDPRLDESAFASEVATFLGTTHTTLDCNPSAAMDVVSLIEQLGLPFGDSSLLPTYWLSKATREHVPVAIGGDGGDELFAGYRRHVVSPHLTSLAWLADLDADSRELFTTKGNEFRRLLAAAQQGYSHLALAFSDAESYQLAAIKRMPHSESVNTFAARVWKELDTTRGHHWDFANYLPGDLLRKVDTASMAVALEVRAPFLDSTLIRSTLAASDRTLMPFGKRKALLRSLAARYLPAPVASRRKQGFAIPIDDWLRSDFGGLGNLAGDVFTDKHAFSENVLGFRLDRRLLNSLWDGHRAGQRNAGQQLYVLMCLGIWSRWVWRQKSMM